MKTHVILAKYCSQCFTPHSTELIFEGEAPLPETVELKGEIFQLAGSYRHPDGDVELLYNHLVEEPVGELPPF